MKSGLFVIYDRVANTFSPPFVVVNTEVAKRYYPVILKEDSRYSRFPYDMSLYHLGSYNSETARFDLFDNPKFIMSGFSETCELSKGDEGGQNVEEK